RVAPLIEGQLARCGVVTPDFMLANVNCLKIARGQGGLFLEQVLLRSGLVIWADYSAMKRSRLGDPGSSRVLAATLVFNISGMAETAETIYFTEDDRNEIT